MGIERTCTAAMQVRAGWQAIHLEHWQNVHFLQNERGFSISFNVHWLL